MPLSPIAQGEIGAIVTSLEMTSRPALRVMPASDLRLERWQAPSPDKYRLLYRRIGEPWLWFSRLELNDTELSAIIHDPKVRIWAALDRRGIEVGILELDFREAGQCEIAFFGLVPELAGKGHGRWLMAMALQAGWAEPGVKRMWVHTCTLDGLIPRVAAPQIPLIA
jgi:GNAT superfamily N-acetyltransferase